MKLIGSKIENEFRIQLLSSNRGLNSHESLLGNILRKNGYITQNSFVLNWTPEQGEDLYTVLINGEYIIYTEIVRESQEMLSPIKKANLKDYLKGLKKRDQLKFFVAQDLAKKNKLDILIGNK